MFWKNLIPRSSFALITLVLHYNYRKSFTGQGFKAWFCGRFKLDSNSIVWSLWVAGRLLFMKIKIDINLSLIISPLGNYSTIIQVGNCTFWTYLFYLLPQLVPLIYSLLTKGLIHKNAIYFKCLQINGFIFIVSKFYYNCSKLFFPALLLL